MQGLPEFDADFTARARSYRERAQLLRLAADAVSGTRRADLSGIAESLEQLADIIERLQLPDE